MVIVPRRHEDDRLAVGGFQDLHDVGGDERTSSEDAEVRGLQMCEQRVVALDRHHRLPRLDAVALVERVHGEHVPVVRAELQDGDRLVHSTEVGVVLLEHLHDDARVSAVVVERRSCVVEVRVGVVPAAHLLDRQVEDLGWEPLARAFPEGHYSSSSSRHASKAASATSICSGVGSAVAIRC